MESSKKIKSLLKIEKSHPIKERVGDYLFRTVWKIPESGIIHRDSGPAVIFPNGTQQWLQYGICHRENGPAIEYNTGAREWYHQGLCHRLNGPAIEQPNDQDEYYYEDEYIPIFY